jgi:hypothetical protein
VDTLFVDSRRILVAEERHVGADPSAEAGELAAEVEPPARVALPEEDHQQGRDEEATGDPAARGADRVTAVVLERPGRAGGEHSDDDGDRNDEHNRKSVSRLCWSG